MSVVAMLREVTGEQRQLGLTSAMAVVMGESIALGIFLTPAAMAKSLGSPVLLLLVWCGMAVMAMSGALCYSALTVRMPKSGGDYVYLREGYGERIAFLYGWMSALVMYPGVAAALAVGAAAYLDTLLGAPGRAGVWLPAGILLLFGAINLLGTRLSGRVLGTLNGLKLVLLFAMVGWAVVSGHAHAANLMPMVARRPASEALLPAIAGAATSAFFSFGGWWEAGKIAGEVREPERNLPLAFVGGVALVTVVYVVISWAFLAVVPIERVSSNIAFVAQFGQALFGTAGARVLSACVVVCVCGGLAALTMAAPRVVYAMAQDGAFFSPFGKMHERLGTPAYAISLQTGLALLVLMIGAFDRILAFVIFSAVVFLALVAGCVFRLIPRAHWGWWFPGAPVLFIACCAVVALLILLHDPGPALAGVAIVLCGEPLRRIFAPQFGRGEPGRASSPLAE